jgi:hypothetical protein
MSRRPGAVLGLALLLVVAAGLVGGPALAAPGSGDAATPVTGSITGPTVVSTNSTDHYHVSGWGGPAVSANGTVVGNLTYYATPVGPNLTGVSFNPASAFLKSNASITATLHPGNATQRISIDIMVSSTYQGKNESTNFSISVSVVRPYVISATIVNPTNATVSAFAVYVSLDGTIIGQVNVSSLAPGASTRVTYDYPTLGLSTGSHTFALSLVQAHGLVTFSNGQTVYTETVYVTGPAPNYTLWYLAGIVAFFGAIFIFLTRVAARRRGAARR